MYCDNLLGEEEWEGLLLLETSSQSRDSKQSDAHLCDLLWLVSWNMVLLVVCQSGWNVISHHGYGQWLPIHTNVSGYQRSLDPRTRTKTRMNFLACSCVHEQAICPYMTLWRNLETCLCPLVDNEIIRKRRLHGNQIFKANFVLPNHKLSFIMCVLDRQHNCRCKIFSLENIVKNPEKSWKNKKVVVLFNLKVTNYGSMKKVQNKVPEFSQPTLM